MTQTPVYHCMVWASRALKCYLLQLCDGDGVFSAVKVRKDVRGGSWRSPWGLSTWDILCS